MGGVVAGGLGLVDPNAMQLAEGWGGGCGLTISRGCSVVVGELFVRQRGNDRRKNVPCLWGGSRYGPVL